MKIFITGGSGFVGTFLASHFLDKGFEVVATGTSIVHNSLSHNKFTYVSANTTRKGKWQELVKEAQVVVNLAGRTIFKPWSREYKEEIYNSRIETTRNLVDAIPAKSNQVFLSTSASGFYGDRNEDLLTEESQPGSGFLAKICIDWENEAMKAKNKGARVAIMRFGTVLAKEGGVLAKMIPLFKMYAGGPLGTGAQWFPWIHMEDLSRAVDFIMDRKEAQGIFNFCAPGQTRNRDFTKALANALKRPSILAAPSFLLRTFMGELGEALLSSQRITPAHLQKMGYTFKYGVIEEALQQIVSE